MVELFQRLRVQLLRIMMMMKICKYIVIKGSWASLNLDLYLQGEGEL